jgi:hypothetical protein
MKDILGLLIAPFALLFIAIVYIAAQVKYFIGGSK